MDQDEPATEIIFQTEHFEAIPHTENEFLINHRGRGVVDDLATGRTFPRESVAFALEAMEQGFHHGATALARSTGDVLSEIYWHKKLRELCKPMGGFPQPITRPILE